jgi:hypothetical protein
LKGDDFGAELCALGLVAFDGPGDGNDLDPVGKHDMDSIQINIMMWFIRSDEVKTTRSDEVKTTTRS